ncbi:MAG: hypothetical protein SGBAC_006958 [Bacillariaceae sp.]
MTKKRNLSVFDAIQELESEDVKAEKKRRKRTTSDRLRAEAAQSQSKIYNHLIECRILLQRATTSSGEEEHNSDVEDNCNTLLQSLLEARSQLVSGDSDVDGKYEGVVNSSSDDLEDVLEEEYEACRDIWKTVLNKRHNDLKLHSGLKAKNQFKVMDSSFWEQVEGTMEYEGLRENADQKDTFDDSKLYQQLLKDFVTTSANANSGTSRPEKKSKKSKSKEVDRRASKGRKIRYKEIPKLVNFTFPLSRNNNSNLNQDEWFQSLFGGVGAKSS